MLVTALLTAAGPVRASVFSEPSSNTWHAAPPDSRARAAACAPPPDHGSLVHTTHFYIFYLNDLIKQKEKMFETKIPKL